jgi:hypothetical protein
MSYKSKINHLEEMHKLLDKQINEMQTNHPGVDTEHLAELKKKKLLLKDEISKLNKLQWEEETQRTGYGDDH